MKILFIQMPPFGHPALASTEHYPAELVKLGHTVGCIAKAGGDPTFLRNAGVQVFEIPESKPWLRSLVAIVRQEAPDVVHTFRHMGCGLYPFLMRTGNRPKFLFDIRSPLLRSGIARVAVQVKNRLEVIGYDIITAHSIESAWTVVGKRGDITFLPPGIQLDLVSHRQYRVSTHPPYRLIYVGSLDPRRRLDQLAIAIIKASKSLPIQLDIYGFKDEVSLETLQHLDTNGLITYHKPIPRAELFQRMVEYDLAISYVPTRLYDAAPPLKTLEYLACGMPTLATNTLGNQMLIKHGQNGWLVDESPDAVSEGILHMLTHTELRQRLATNARSSVEEYDWQSIVRNWLLPVYRNIVAE